MKESILKLWKEYYELISFLAGILVVVVAYTGYSTFIASSGAYYSDEVHVHSDFIMVLNGTEIDFSGEQYQSSIEQILHPDFHFHDGDDHVIHRHAKDLTLVEFLDSLGFEMTSDCIVTDAEETYCSDETAKLLLYVNNEQRNDLETYIPEEEDQILIYFGEPNEVTINAYLTEITDEACIYSGTCPERGTPPPESCGITCEI